MEKKVTIQDIADALGLSRNTVSKALNNTGVLAEETRQKILEKAAEMGYRRFIYLAQPSAAENTECPAVSRREYRSKRTGAVHTEHALRLSFRNLCAEYVSGKDKQE